MTRIKWFSYYPACRSQKGRGNVKRDAKLGRKNERRKSKSKRKDWNGNSSERKNEKRRNESEKQRNHAHGHHETTDGENVVEAEAAAQEDLGGDEIGL